MASFINQAMKTKEPMAIITASLIRQTPPYRSPVKPADRAINAEMVLQLPSCVTAWIIDNVCTVDTLA